MEKRHSHLEPHRASPLVLVKGSDRSSLPQQQQQRQQQQQQQQQQVKKVTPSSYQQQQQPPPLSSHVPDNQELTSDSSPQPGSQVIDIFLSSCLLLLDIELTCQRIWCLAL